MVLPANFETGTVNQAGGLQLLKIYLRYSLGSILKRDCYNLVTKTLNTNK